MTISASPNETFIVSATSLDGRSDLHLKAEILDSSNTVIDTFNIPHVYSGVYSTNKSLATEGQYNLLVTFWMDAGYTIPADYAQGVEIIKIDSWKTNLLRILGLVHENAVIDQHVIDAEGRTLSARIRVYDSPANANAAQVASPADYATGLLFQYTSSTTYTGATMSTHKIVRDI